MSSSTWPKLNSLSGGDGTLDVGCGGKVFDVPRRNAAETFNCSMATLWKQGGVEDVGRIDAKACLTHSFGCWLAKLNGEPHRRYHHWPSVYTPDDKGTPHLVCSKCGTQVPHTRKLLFLRAICDRREQQAAADLNRGEPVYQEAHRGGLRLGTLNIGTLYGREAALPELHIDIVCCQETCIAPHKQTSVSRSLRSLNATVQWGKIRQEDLRQRGRTWGVRLGVGLAIIAFRPWCVKSCSHHFPDSPQDREVEHRLLSAVISDGFRSIFVHTAYADPQQRDGLTGAIYNTILHRIVTQPHSYHVVCGDFQTDARFSPLGVALADRGWAAHGSLTNGQPTNRPHRGEDRRLDELWISPNLARFIAGAELEWPIGWSTHGLLYMECRFVQEERRGWKSVRGLKEEELRRKIEEASERPWPRVPRVQGEHSYAEWIRCLRAWLDVDADKIGARTAVEAIDEGKGIAPLKPRAMWRHNVAKRLQARVLELRAIWTPGAELSPRGQTLISSLRRIPSCFWTGYRTSAGHCG